MASFFADDSDDDLSPRAGPSRYAAPAAQPPSVSAGRASSTSFLDRALSSRLGSPSTDDGIDLDLDLGLDPPPERANINGAGADDTIVSGDADLPLSDTVKLMRAWVAERTCSSLLKWENDLVDGIMWRLEQQVCAS